MNLICFLTGLFIGFVGGVIVICLCSVNKQADVDMEDING